MPETDLQAPRTGRVDIVVDGAIARVVVNNPAKLNAVSEEMWRQIASGLKVLEHDTTVRCVVFEGDGDRAFCTGADISEKTQRAAEETAKTAHQDDPTYSTLSAIQSFPKPTIALIAGYCLGAGIALAASCDLRIANRSAKFSFPAARLGLAPGYSVIKRLTDLVGPANTKRILFVADRFPADEALRLGLIDEVTPDDDLAAVGNAMAAKIAANAPLTLAAAKHAVEKAMTSSGEIDISEYVALEQICSQSEDYEEGRRAFAEKRPPNFIGR